MTTRPRQFQGYAADRQESPRDVVRGDPDLHARQGFAAASPEALRASANAAPSREGLVPVSNLSISSWYAISGTAMA